MIEDKLTADQRIRLECLAQANALAAAQAARRLASEPVLEVAADFERYVRDGLT